VDKLAVNRFGQVISSWFGTFPGNDRFRRWVGPQSGSGRSLTANGVDATESGRTGDV